jgi:hypothetical protein
MILNFSVGDFTIYRVIEQEAPFLPAREVLPTLTPELLFDSVDASLAVTL